MFKKLSYKILKSFVRKYYADSDREKRFLNFSQVNSVLLLFESDLQENNQEIKKIIAYLKDENKQVSSYGFTKKKTSIYGNTLLYDMLTTKDFNLFGKPRKALMEKIQHEDYDLVIDLTKQPSINLTYLLILASAKCKSGLQKEICNFYDFAINLDSYAKEQNLQIDDLPIDFIFQQIIFYLKNIQSKD